MSFTIGVDVGGTNTDVAIIHGNNIIGWSKSSTTEKIIDGVVTSITLAFKNAEKNGYENIKKNINKVNIGTTHFINAVIKRQDLAKVACIRLCGNASVCLPPFVDFPDDLKEEINGGSFLLNGGFEFNEKVITEINEKEIVDTFEIISENGIQHVAVSGIFSPTNSSQEDLVGKLIKKHYPEFTYTLSNELGHLGLLERENAAILNETLKPLCKKTIAGFKTALKDIGLDCPVYFTQNDGTLISENLTLQFPVYTFSSGATNSMRGAAHLSSLKDAIIVDIGGTSTDVGVLMNGFPREASSRVKVGGVNTNFRMPDTTSVGLGGGSIIAVDEDQNVSVGPSSVEYRITKEALIFGGSTMVASDIVVACGLTELGDKTKVVHITMEIKEKAMKIIQEKVELAVDSVKLSGEICPVVLVGGGSILIDPSRPFVGAASVIKPPFYQVANAVGAALSQVSGKFDKVVAISETNTREKILENAKTEAINMAVANGAIRETCNIVDISEVQLAYMTLPCMRLRVKAVGDLEDYKEQSASNVSMVGISDPLIDVNVTDTLSKMEEGESNDLTSSNNSETKVSQAQQRMLNTPELNEFGEWIFSLYDVDCLAIGAGILGCGGGGSPYLGRLRLEQQVKMGKRPRVVNPFSLKQGERAYSVAYMGAPEILIEKINNGSELSCSLQVCQGLREAGFNGNINDDEIACLAEKLGLQLEKSPDGSCTAVNFKKNDNVSKPGALMVAEVGGANAMEPLIVASDLDIPVLDCDGMGRAFPELQHFSPFIHGCSPYPAVISDVHGNYVCCVKASSANDLENFFRLNIIEMGCDAGMCIAALSKEDVESKTCHHTISQAWHLGNAVIIARQAHQCPINVIVEHTKGIILCQGKISDLKRETKEGFTRGKIIVEGSGSYLNKGIYVEFQNEFVIVRSSQSDEVLATVPDLITVVDTDFGEPITADVLKYGLRVSVLVLPAVPIMTTPKALEFVGPRAFKYDVDYHKVCEFKATQPIPKCNNQQRKNN